MTRRRSLLLAGSALALVLAVLLVWQIVRTASTRPSAELRGAQAAAEAYVAAIADADPETADAMTDPEELKVPKTDDLVGITDALTAVVDPITDPWITRVGPGVGTHSHVFAVSYAIGELTGDGTFEVSLQRGADPAELDRWTVTDPLIMRAAIFGDGTKIPTVTVGDVEVSIAGQNYRPVLGYPGGYRVKAESLGPWLTAKPNWVPVGAEPAPTWSEQSPKVTAVASKKLIKDVRADITGRLEDCVDSPGPGSTACAKLPEDWLLVGPASQYTITSGRWHYEQPDIEIEPDLSFMITGGDLSYRITEGRVKESGESADGAVLNAYLAGPGRIVVSEDSYRLVWN